MLESWGLRVEFGVHCLDKLGHFLAGSDKDRLADINDALRDPGVRAIITTRGGKGAYRIAHALDFGQRARTPNLWSGIATSPSSTWPFGGNAGSPAFTGLTLDGAATMSVMMPPRDFGALSWSRSRSSSTENRVRSQPR
jgi:muramoyltetrapeptide carboxypeptidase